jgi:hypothetical protein
VVAKDLEDRFLVLRATLRNAKAFWARSSAFASGLSLTTTTTFDWMSPLDWASRML